MIRRSVDVLLRLLAVLLAAGLCSFLTIYQPVLRIVYDALATLGSFVLHPGPVWEAVGANVLADYRHSILALTAGMGIALLLGVPAGLLVGARPNSRLGSAVRLLSYMGTIMPSFLLALFSMIFFVLYLLPLTGIRFILLTSQTPGFDPRRLLPIALTLAARPLAFYTTVTAAAMREVLARDYIRTAYSKGLSRRQVLWRHAWPNVLPSVLDAIPPTLLFSVSSLPIIEFVFNWPGIGQELLFRVVASPAPNAQNAARVTFLLASLGLTYVLVSLLAESARRRIEPRHGMEDDQ